MTGGWVGRIRAALKGTDFYPWYAVFILTLASVISYVDRQILAIMIGPVRRDLDITDTQVSLLIGAAFALFFTTLTLPIARLSDRYSRRTIIAVGIFVWSLMTLACGLAQRYSHLFVARMGVGVGEAALAPAAYSMMSDYFTKERLPLAVGVFQSATFVGTGIAYIFGGYLVEYLESIPSLSVPVVGEIRSWQAAFFIVSVPGLLLAGVIYLLREPDRTGLMRAEQNSAAMEASDVSMADLFRFARSRWKLFSLLFSGFLLMATQGFALFAWGAEFLIRTHDMSRSEAGLAFGLIALIVGISGSITGGIASTWIMSRGIPDGTMWVGVFKCVAITPFAVAMGFVSSGTLAVALLIPVTFLMSLTPGLGAAIVQSVTPNQLRAQMVAVYGIAVGFLSYLLAPLMVALLTQYVFLRDDAVGYSLGSMALVVYPLAALVLYLGLKHYRAALTAAETWEAPSKS